MALITNKSEATKYIVDRFLGRKEPLMKVYQEVPLEDADFILITIVKFKFRETLFSTGPNGKNDTMYILEFLVLNQFLLTKAL